MKRKLYRLFGLIMAALLVMQALPVWAQSEPLKILFCGTVQPIDPLAKPYSQEVGAYLTNAKQAEAEIVEQAQIDLDAESFMAAAEKAAKEQADVVFLEWNVSKRYRGSDTEAKVEAVVQKLLAGDKTPAIYFIYTPQENFLDLKDPFNAVAEHYGIRVIDAHSRFKALYTAGTVEMRDFLTAGVKPAEGGADLWAKVIVNELKNIQNLFTPAQNNQKPKHDTSRYAVTGTSGEAEQPQNGEMYVLYVAKGGSDSASGTEKEPLGSLEGAKNRIRDLKKQQGDAFGGATVYVREGLYTVSESFVLNEEDSGTESASITYRAYSGETVRLTNATKLDSRKFKLVTDMTTLKRIPSKARGYVYEYDLAAAGLSAGTYREKNPNYYSTGRELGLGNLLITDGHMGERAKYPNGDYARVSSKHSGNSTEISYSANKGDAWKTVDDAFIKGQLGQGYYKDVNRVKSIDTENKVIKMHASTPYTVKVGWPWQIVNLLEELDIPGEWYANRFNGKLYYYPRGEMTDEEILFSSNLNPVVKLEDAENITIEGMIIEGSCKDGVQILNGRNNKIKDCEIRNIGRAGVYIQSDGQMGKTNNGIDGCFIHDTALMGAYLYGGDTKDLTAQENYVINSYFENYCSEMSSETGAIVTEKTFGAVVKNCTIHNATAPAMFMGGNDDNISYNEFYNVSRFTDDYGVLYGDSNGAFRQGVRVNHNYFHDVTYTFPDGLYNGFLAGFYSDANRNNGAEVSHNAFVRIRNPIFFANNHNMTAEQNVMLDSEKNSIVCSEVPSGDNAIDTAITESAEDGSFFDLTSEGDASKKFGNVLVYRAWATGLSLSEDILKKYYLKYPWLETYLYSNPLKVKYLKVNDNAGFGAEDKINLYEGMGDTFETEGNYISSTSIPYDEGSTSDVARINHAMQLAKENTREFEIWDVTEAGAPDEMLTMKDFSLIYPYQNATNVDVSALDLRWDFAGGADEYHVMVATDRDFKNVVFEDVTRENYATATGLQFGVKQYYWKVEARSFNEKAGEPKLNLGGVYTFVSQKDEVTEQEELNDTLKMAAEFLTSITEGTEGGCYPTGTKAKFESIYNAAKAVAESKRSSQADIDEAVQNVVVGKRQALADRILEEVDLSTVFAGKANISVNWVSENKVKSAEEAEEVTELSGGGVHIKGLNGGAYANQMVEAHQIVRFTGTFDFSGDASPSNYVMLGLRTESMSRYMFDVPSYVFLVTKDNIELQGFKGTGKSGKFYMTVPNTFIREGEAHDIEFGALPAKDGNAVRIILSVDGVTVYDHIDETNIVENAGYAGIIFSRATAGLTVEPAKTDAAYPSLRDRLLSEAK